MACAIFSSLAAVLTAAAAAAGSAAAAAAAAAAASWRFSQWNFSPLWFASSSFPILFFFYLAKDFRDRVLAA